MYDGRWTMDDGGRQSLPMYDVRCTMYDGGRQSLPMYDGRCTMYDCDVRRRWRGGERSRSEG